MSVERQELELVSEPKWDNVLDTFALTLAGVEIHLHHTISENDARLIEKELKLAIFDEATKMIAASHGWGDAPLPEDEAIKAAHPNRTGRHDLYLEALRLVGARRGKAGLVELVNWLLADRATWKESAKNWEKLHAGKRERTDAQRCERCGHIEDVHAPKCAAPTCTCESFMSDPPRAAEDKTSIALNEKRLADMAADAKKIDQQIDITEKQLEELRVECEKWKKSATDWEETAGNQSDLAAKEWGRAEDLKCENARLLRESNPSPVTRLALDHLLTILGCRTSARWDQILSDEFGDDVVQEVQSWLLSVGIDVSKHGSMRHGEYVEIRRKILAEYHERKDEPSATDGYIEKMDRVEKQLEDLRAERDKYRKRKDEAYEERNRLVALFVRMALALGWKAGIGEHEDKEGVDWHPEWRTLVVVETPEGQASWHFHDSHKHLLEGLPTVVAKWDGHDTPTKYERLLRLTRKSIVTSGSGERRNCIPALRPALATFAALCEQVLRDNDHKGGWEDESSEWLFERLKEEVEELGQIMTLRLTTPTVIAREAADVANFAMMIADKHGWLPEEVSNEAKETSGQQSADDESSARGQGAAGVEPVVTSKPVCSTCGTIKSVIGAHMDVRGCPDCIKPVCTTCGGTNVLPDRDPGQSITKKTKPCPDCTEPVCSTCGGTGRCEPLDHYDAGPGICPDCTPAPRPREGEVVHLLQQGARLAVQVCGQHVSAMLCEPDWRERLRVERAMNEAIAAHVAAEVAKARADEAVRIIAFLKTTKAREVLDESIPAERAEARAEALEEATQVAIDCLNAGKRDHRLVDAIRTLAKKDTAAKPTASEP